ncbi:hypothetical protein EK21DRAFT_81893 [Setomelanomma holmii]|uniref:RING-type domain-containing protein n=1 Tax=Setomelanomma holmii TaxID=210430 RepID=A0A9P4LF80_9PLEO|nr:hypothetical protein EK21DRAFT_81893 [Setomelanomma holmii]
MYFLLWNLKIIAKGLARNNEAVAFLRQYDILKYKVHFLTWLDAAVALPPSVFSILQRLNFYKGRALGHSVMDTEANLHDLRKVFKIPDSWLVYKEISHLNEKCKQLRQEQADCMARFNEAAKVVWDGTPIAMSEITTVIPTEELVEQTCIVCTDSLTPPGVRTPCGHVYCPKCLDTWIHGLENLSHTCPACRAELFAPRYRVKEPDAAENYQRVFQKLELELKNLQVSIASVLCFDEEIKLQKRWEQETGQGSILLTE